MSADKMWQARTSDIANANMTQFLHFINQQQKTSLSNYQALHQWSVQASEQFWQSLWQFCGVKASKSAEQVLKEGETIAKAQWFPGAQLNFADNLLARDDAKQALVFYNEKAQRQVVSYTKLRHKVACVAASLKRFGVTKGDRVAAYMPNCIETVVAMLATASIGAIWSSCSPDFGVNGVLDRFGQIKPKVLFTVNNYYYGGKVLDCMAKVQAIAEQIISL